MPEITEETIVGTGAKAVVILDNQIVTMAQSDLDAMLAGGVIRKEPTGSYATVSDGESDPEADSVPIAGPEAGEDEAYHADPDFEEEPTYEPDEAEVAVEAGEPEPLSEAEVLVGSGETDGELDSDGGDSGDTDAGVALNESVPESAGLPIPDDVPTDGGMGAPTGEEDGRAEDSDLSRNEGAGGKPEGVPGDSERPDQSDEGERPGAPGGIPSDGVTGGADGDAGAGPGSDGESVNESESEPERNGEAGPGEPEVEPGESDPVVQETDGVGVSESADGEDSDGGKDGRPDANESDDAGVEVGGEPEPDGPTEPPVPEITFAPEPDEPEPEKKPKSRKGDGPVKEVFIIARVTEVEKAYIEQLAKSVDLNTGQYVLACAMGAISVEDLTAILKGEPTPAMGDRTAAELTRVRSALND